VAVCVALVATTCIGVGIAGADVGEQRRCRAAPFTAPKGPSAEAVSIGRVDGRPIDAVVYPRPEHPAGADNPWSQWGQGLALSDGRFLSAAGDHRGPDGNSYLYVYDPQERRIVRFTDVLSNVDHQRGAWGYGKVHAQIVAGSCRDAYVATYWGTDENLRYGSGYRGDQLFRLDTRTLGLEPLGVPLPEHGIPSLAGAKGVLFGEAPTPTTEDAAGSEEGSFFAYDLDTHEVVFRTDDDRHVGFRNVLVGADGTAYVAGRDGALLEYDPGTKELREAPSKLPGGGFLRASTVPDVDGTVYGVTHEPDELFAMRSDGTIEDLGRARGYTTSMALHPDGSRFFYVPGASGTSWKHGTPLISVDTQTGEQSTVAELNPLAEDKLGLTLGGSYSVAVDPSRDRVYIGFNAGRDRDDPWGEVVLVVVNLS
jgi:hypothetical protein